MWILFAHWIHAVYVTFLLVNWQCLRIQVTPFPQTQTKLCVPLSLFHVFSKALYNLIIRRVTEVSQDILGEWDHISHSFNKYILINYQRCARVHTCTHENTQYAQGLVVPLRGLRLYVFYGEWVLLYPGLWGWLSSFSGSLWPSSRPGQPLYSIMRGTGAGDMANWLRALIALLDDPGSVPSNHMVTHSYNSSQGHPTCSSGLHGTRHSYGAPKHADKNT